MNEEGYLTIIDNAIKEVGPKKAHSLFLRALRRACPKRDQLSEVFDRQMEILESGGIDREIVSVFRDMKDSVLAQELEIWNKQYRQYPLLYMLEEIGVYLGIPVIPWQYYSHRIEKGWLCIVFLANILEDRGRRGASDIQCGGDWLRDTRFRDEIEVPYFVFDVHDGRETVGDSIKSAEEKIRKKECFPLSLEEGIFLCSYVRLYNVCSIGCLGSVYSRSEAPGIVAGAEKTDGPAVTVVGIYDGHKEYWPVSLKNTGFPFRSATYMSANPEWLKEQGLLPE